MGFWIRAKSPGFCDPKLFSSKKQFYDIFLWAVPCHFFPCQYFPCRAVPRFSVPGFSVPGRAINLRVPRSVPCQGVPGLLLICFGPRVLQALSSLFPETPLEEISDPHLTPIPSHPRIKYVARSPRCDKLRLIKATF